MRISDWISDVCSSDLLAAFAPCRQANIATLFSSWNGQEAPLPDRGCKARAAAPQGQGLPLEKSPAGEDGYDALFCASSRHGISGPRTPAGGRAMRQFIERHSFWSFVILIALGVFLWLVFAVWPEWLEDAIGRKKTFVNTFLNGLTLAGLYFLNRKRFPPDWREAV